MLILIIIFLYMLIDIFMLTYIVNSLMDIQKRLGRR